MNFKWKKKYTAAIIVAIVGAVLTVLTYFATDIYQKDEVALITDDKIKDTLIEKNEDVYKNQDQTRQQILYLKILSGKHKGETYTTKNVYYPSQLTTQKYHAHQRIFVNIKKGDPAIVNPKRDWVLVLVVTITLALMVTISGKHSIALVISMAISWVLFYLIIVWDVHLNGSHIILLFSLADIIFSFFSLLIVQGFNKKMLVTWLATLLGVFVSFALCYVIMKLTGESEMKYETGDYATQDPRGLFLAQTLIGILGAVMDEATDIVSSLYELIQTKKDITMKQLVQSGRTMGQEIMGPLINVLVLIFIAGALPETILYLRDNNTLASTFGFTLSLGATQSVISAIGIVLTVIFATGCSLFFIKDRDWKSLFKKEGENK
ncbi:YibE/F family protein [Lactobacillus acidophilus]|uniref:YibE/F family protein n=1 Tax=Lactobacillus acidophilus TaxID=1579 RepID=UPI0021A263F4|nr:YibE/F family protein [Lactobacillus acidophilus]MCT3602189.1 YibE/F family protein [Lactobacillus acidophilus]MCT3623774.1 YibE/F family protein [Lactobacillus acidophilus]